MKLAQPKILILYATTEGHTKHVCERAATMLREAGARVTLADFAQAPRAPTIAFDGVILAGALRFGRYPKALVDYATRYAAALNEIGSALLSVSLSAAGANPGDWAGLGQRVEALKRSTRWRPAAVSHVGGALRYSEYGFLLSRLMWLIAWAHGIKTFISRDYDLADYRGLARFVLAFASLPRHAPGAPPCAMTKALSPPAAAPGISLRSG